MTREEREEAIKVIENRFSIMDYCESEKLGEALDMAIAALKSEPCGDKPTLEEFIKYAKDKLGTNITVSKSNNPDTFEKIFGIQPCEDAVNREAVMKLKSHKPEYGDMIYAFDVELLPAVIPARKKGKWIKLQKNRDGTSRCKCSNCNNTMQLSIHTFDTFNFCPNCGSEMESET